MIAIAARIEGDRSAMNAGGMYSPGMPKTGRASEMIRLMRI
jgi:hypothetical protein